MILERKKQTAIFADDMIVENSKSLQKNYYTEERAYQVVGSKIIIANQLHFYIPAKPIQNVILKTIIYHNRKAIKNIFQEEIKQEMYIICMQKIIQLY